MSLHPKAAHLALLGYQVFMFQPLGTGQVMLPPLAIRIMRAVTDMGALAWSDTLNSAHWFIRPLATGNHYALNPDGWDAVPFMAWEVLTPELLNTFIGEALDC